MDLGLAGRTALVLGGGGGLGRAIAKALAREGARVAVGDIDAAALDATVREIEGAGSEGLPLTWDLADLALIDERVSAIERQLRAGRRAGEQHRRPAAYARIRPGLRPLEPELPVHGAVGDRHHRQGAARDA